MNRYMNINISLLRRYEKYIRNNIEDLRCKNIGGWVGEYIELGVNKNE